MTGLLTRGNPKILKGEKLGYLTWVFHGAPADLSGYQVCASSTEECVLACLNTAGRGGIVKRGETTNAIQEARIRKTKLYFENRPAFLAQLVREIENAVRYAERKKLAPCFRLNATSDIRWETVPVVRGSVVYPNIMSAFPAVQFYDYTKHVNRRHLPPNYSITFSRSGKNGPACFQALLDGQNVAVVFRGGLPATYYGATVIDGDISDLRFLDPKGVIVGLKAKGLAKRQATLPNGFVVDALALA